MVEIIVLTLVVNGLATAVSMILGTVLGFKLYKSKCKYKGIVIQCVKTLMAMPPVVLGLLLFLVFKQSGPLGFFRILYTPTILILTQVLLITPIVCGNVVQLLESKASRLMFTLNMYHIKPLQQLKCVMTEYKNELLFILVVGFSRAVSEVGAVMIVGGNIKSETRMMTTAIANLRSQGEYQEAIIFGVILIVIAFLIQSLLSYFYEVSYENI